MNVSFRCPNGHSLTVEAKFAGSAANCPKCGASVTVPLPTSDPNLKDVSTASATGKISPQQLLMASIAGGAILLLTLMIVAGIYLYKSGSKFAAPHVSADNTAAADLTDNSSIAEGVAENTLAANSRVQSLPNRIQRTAPESDSPGFKLIETADYFALDTLTGDLAAVTSQSQNLYVYSAQYLATGKGNVMGPVDAGRAPGPIAFKRYKNRAYYLVADLNDPKIRIFDAESLELVNTLDTPARHNTSICVSPDADDGRFYFCTNPYSPMGKGEEYFICAADMSDPQTVRIAFQSRDNVTHCYVSPKQGFLYGRRFEYIHPIFLEQAPLNDLTVSGETVSVLNRVTHEGLLVDPNGAGVAMKYSVLSHDLQTELQKYKFVIQCFLVDRPYVAGFNFNTDAKGNIVNSLSLKVARLDSPDIVHDLDTGFKEIPSGISWQNTREIWKFLSQAGVFHSQVTDSIVMAYRDTVFTFGLKELELPIEPSPLPIVEYPSRVRALTKTVVTMKVPADPNALFTLSNAPEGAMLENNVLTWTPKPSQMGKHVLQLQWSSGGREGKMPLSIFVDSVDGSLASAGLTPEILKLTRSWAEASRKKTSNSLPKVTTIEPGTTAYSASFPIERAYASGDGNSAVCLGCDVGGQPQERRADVVTHCAVLDLNSGEIKAQSDITMNVVEATMDSHYVYLKGAQQFFGSPVMVLSRHNLSHHRDLLCSNNSDFGAFADRVLVSTNVYAVPDLRIVRSRNRALRGPYKGTPSVVAQNQMRSFYRRTADGYVINGLQYDENLKQPKMVFATDLFGSLQFANSRDTQPNSYPDDVHPSAPIKFEAANQGTMASLVVRAVGSKPNVLLKEFSLGLNRHSRPALDVHRDFVLVAAGGIVYRVDISEIRDAELVKQPRFLNQQDTFLAILDHAATFQYKIQGGTPPYASIPIGGNSDEGKLEIKGDQAQYSVTFSHWDRSQVESLIEMEKERRKGLLSIQQNLTGFPTPLSHSTHHEVVDELLKQLRAFCTNRLKTKIPDGFVPVPQRVTLKAKDASGTVFETVHFVFVAVMESEIRDDFNIGR